MYSQRELLVYMEFFGDFTEEEASKTKLPPPLFMQTKGINMDKTIFQHLIHAHNLYSPEAHTYEISQNGELKDYIAYSQPVPANAETID